MYRNLAKISLSLSLLCIGSVHVLKTPRIVGGSSGYVPYAASILHKQGFFVCGGVIISKTVVATTARCATLFRAEELLVRSGSSYKYRGGSVTRVLRTARPENFTVNSPDYDVGVLLLGDAADEKSQAIKLAKEEVNDGEVLTISGWGSTKENGSLSVTVNSASVRKIGRDECQRSYAGEYEITSRMICGSSPGAGPCKGDVGGPVVRGGLLVGIMSFGSSCGKRGRPGVFTNVAAPEIRKFLEKLPKVRAPAARANAVPNA